MKNVSITGLTKFYGGVRAVDGVAFEIDRGQLVTLLGPSGCGKTTTLNMIAGFENPDGGEIRIGDTVISSSAKRILLPPHMRNLGMVFQSYALWPHMTVAQNVGYGMRMRGYPRATIRQQVEEALRLVRLAKFADRYPGQLSGGQQQRVAFARAIAYRPDVLLLDEPLSNLDATLREEMRTEIKELQGKVGLTTIFVTHDQIEAMSMSDKIVVMNQGRIEQIGSPSEVYDRPANAFVASFVGVANLLTGEVAQATASDGTTVVRVGESVLSCPLGQANAGDAVVLSVRPESLTISGERPQEPSGNVLPSTVEKVIYMGGSREIWIRIGEQQLRIQGYRLPQVAPGQLIYCRIPPEAIRLVQY